MSESAFTAAQLQASTLYLPPGPWLTVLDCLCERFSAISREQWLDRIARGRVLNGDGQPIARDLPYREGLRIHYFREVPNETPIPVKEAILYADEHLVVADKPHFLPVTPAGEYVEQTLLRRLIRTLDNPHLVPLHRIDRHTAGLVLFSANKDTRSAYQALFPTRRIDKRYEAIARALPDLEFPRVHKSRLIDGEPFFRMQEGEGQSNTETRIEVCERNGELWRYGLYPVTGKKHQLRVHMAALGAGICNDPFYPDVIKDAVDDYDNPLKLLAQGLRFIDPVTGQERVFESEIKLEGWNVGPGGEIPRRYRV
jgi:tRNA pseudouridine32 synthase/23S rRNA pseudouridine746 synthase